MTNQTSKIISVIPAQFSLSDKIGGLLVQTFRASVVSTIWLLSTHQFMHSYFDNNIKGWKNIPECVSGKSAFCDTFSHLEKINNLALRDVPQALDTGNWAHLEPTTADKILAFAFLFLFCNVPFSLISAISFSASYLITDVKKSLKSDFMTKRMLVMKKANKP